MCQEQVTHSVTRADAGFLTLNPRSFQVTPLASSFQNSHWPATTADKTAVPTSAGTVPLPSADTLAGGKRESFLAASSAHHTPLPGATSWQASPSCCQSGGERPAAPGTLGRIVIGVYQRSSPGPFNHIHSNPPFFHPSPKP